MGAFQLPGLFQDLPTQSFIKLPLDFDSLQWSPLEERGQQWVVARVTHEVYEEFQKGEITRGDVSIVRRECKGKNNNGHLLFDHQHDCSRGCFTHAADKAKAAAGPDLRPSPDDGVVHRRSRIAIDMSIKMGCMYSYIGRCYALAPGAVYLKFKLGCQDHKDSAGDCVHLGSASNRTLSDECREWVRRRLLMRAAPKVVLEGMPR